LRIIEVVADAGHTDTLKSMAEQHGAVDTWCGVVDEDGRQAVHMLVPPETRQALLDAIQNILGGSDNFRLLVLPVDAALPRPSAQEEQEKARAVSTTREELYNEIEKGARLERNYLLMVVLSTFVVTIGLIEDNVTVVVGAMVIAPLLGPNIAFAFATSLGDTGLMGKALRTALAGLGLALAVAYLIGLIWPVNLESREILARTDVGLDSVALALVSGAAAVVSLTTGVSTALVGVMVAVALLPPTATLGMLLGSGQVGLAVGAALLLAVNVVSVILAAKLVFLAKGVKPRTWLEKRQAEQSTKVYTALWVVTLSVLVAVILVREALAT
jgi:uncharacterized hydrophobic protein (TIGR00341 family)